MINDKVSKVYYARVKGNFKQNIGEEYINKQWVYTASIKDSLMACEESDKLTDDFKKSAKEAETLFKFQFYDEKSDSSVLKYIF